MLVFDDNLIQFPPHLSANPVIALFLFRRWCHHRFSGFPLHVSPRSGKVSCRCRVTRPRTDQVGHMSSSISATSWMCDGFALAAMSPALSIGCHLMSARSQVHM